MTTVKKDKEVKKLLRKLLLLALPFILWPLIEVFLLPMDVFTFRIWETISVNTVRIMPGPFYPNVHMKMVEEGELAPRTPYAEKRPVEWFTDAYGYRNRDTKNDVLLIGDSNITGAKLSQDETLAEVLEARLNRPVYSFAPATMNRFLATDRFEKDPPHLVIVSSIERRIPGLPAVGANGLNSEIRDFTGTLISSSSFLTNLAVTADRISKLGLYRRTLADMDRALGRKEYISYNNEFFIEGEIANREFSEEEITQIAAILEGYKIALQERGIQFLFLPIPNKENIYYKLLPSQQKATFLPRLFAELDKREVPYVDLQPSFNRLYQQEEVPLFPADDAHWNQIAVKVAAKLLSEHATVAQLKVNTTENKEQSLLVNHK
ncbi:alginate O-acetyltransferase AlgX-related protein [Pontibacter rugosus]|uniref:AlgX/AlgJ SGNH hydrolase-like domain-containing protein n=1 Tax=Pontibacter rugosus TaxID=1745966 RepID=A0ABW3SS93_9BACT